MERLVRENVYLSHLAWKNLVRITRHADMGLSAIQHVTHILETEPAVTPRWLLQYLVQ